MAWGARWGLKHFPTTFYFTFTERLNGLGSPLGIETQGVSTERTSLKTGLNGLGSPLGIPTKILGEGNGKKKAHESCPEEEVWEEEAFLRVWKDLGRHLLLAIEKPLGAGASSWDGTARG